MPVRVNRASIRFAALMHNELNSSAILARCSVPELKELRVLRAIVRVYHLQSLGFAY